MRRRHLPLLSGLFGLPGIHGDEMAAWIGLMAPDATPAPIVARLNQELNTTLPMITTPGEFAQRLNADLARFRDVLPHAGIGLD